MWLWEDDSYEVRKIESYFYNQVNAKKELCDLCISFVIDCAVEIQDSDYETSKYLVTTHL